MQKHLMNVTRAIEIVVRFDRKINVVKINTFIVVLVAEMYWHSS